MGEDSSRRWAAWNLGSTVEKVLCLSRGVRSTYHWDLRNALPVLWICLTALVSQMSTSVGVTRTTGPSEWVSQLGLWCVLRLAGSSGLYSTIFAVQAMDILGHLAPHAVVGKDRTGPSRRARARDMGERAGQSSIEEVL